MTVRAPSSTPVIRAGLLWSAVACAAIVLGATGIGLAVAGGAGAGSGALGGAIGFIFPALTAVSMLVGNRFFGEPAYPQILFGIVAGAWVAKFLLVLLAFALLLRVEWIVGPVFFFALVATAIASVIVDMVTVVRMRLPSVSDVDLPTTHPEAGRPGDL